MPIILYAFTMFVSLWGASAPAALCLSSGPPSVYFLVLETGIRVPGYGSGIKIPGSNSQNRVPEGMVSMVIDSTFY